MSTLATYRTDVALLVPGATTALSTTELDRAIEDAVRRHNRSFPDMVVEDLDGADAFAFACSGLSRWEDDFSTIHQIEYPVDDDSQAKDILEPCDWELYKKPAGLYIHMLADTPTTGETVRVTYTARHTIAADACTIPAAHEDAVLALCASHVCRILAAKNAQNAAPAFAADSANTSSMRQEYEAQANKFYKQYCDMMGIHPNKPKPVSITQDHDFNYPGGADRLTHGRRYR